MLTPSCVSPYSPETALQTANWGLVNAAFTDAMNRAPWIHSRGGLDLFGKNEFTGEASRVNATITGDLQNNLAQAMDFLAGVANVTTGGLSLRLLNALGVGYLIDTSTTAFAVGQIAGVVVLMVLPGGGVLGTSMLAMQVVGNLWNAFDAYWAGDYGEMAKNLVFAATGGARLLNSLGVTGRIGAWVSNASAQAGGFARSLGGGTAQIWNGAAAVGNGIGRVGMVIGRGVGAAADGSGVASLTTAIGQRLGMSGWSLGVRVAGKLALGFADGIAVDGIYQGLGILTGSQQSYDWRRGLTSGAFGAVAGLFKRTCFTGETKLMARGT